MASWRIVERSPEAPGWTRLVFADEHGRKETRVVPEALALDDEALRRIVERLDLRPRSPRGLVERP
jgi:hypothetical protein